MPEKPNIPEIKTLLESLISSNKFADAIKELESLGQGAESKFISNEVINIKGRHKSLKELIVSGAISNEDTLVEENKFRASLMELKDKALDILENGEPEETPIVQGDIAPAVVASTGFTIIDYAILGLSCLVFIVLLVAFSIALFTDPVKVGLIAFASAMMIGIIMYLRKYRRDMGNSVFQAARSKK